MHVACIFHATLLDAARIAPSILVTTRDGRGGPPKGPALAIGRYATAAVARTFVGHALVLVVYMVATQCHPALMSPLP
jgi:hypothetical protein